MVQYLEIWYSTVWYSTVQTEGSHMLVPRPNVRRMPEIMVCRILLFMWPFGHSIETGASGGWGYIYVCI